MTLSNNATATYQSGTGSPALVFRYTVASGNTDSSDLSVSSYSGTITDTAGNSAGAASGDLGSVIVDANAPIISSVSPSSSSSASNTNIAYNLSEAIASGSVVWTRTSGSTDGSSPHTANLTGSELNSGSFSSAALTNAPTLVDGTVYTLTFNALDAAGNAASQVSITDFTYDTTGPSITISSSQVSDGHTTDNSSITLTFKSLLTY